MRNMKYPIDLLKGVSPEMPEEIRRIKICENFKKEIENRTAFELSHYLSDFTYNTIGFQFILSFVFPVGIHEFDSLFGEVS